MESHAQSNKSGVFCTTQWTTVLNARDQHSPECVNALQGLCSTYWFPLYALARRKGLQPVDAQDAVQGFFESMLEREFLTKVERHKGKFRTFLVMALDRFLINRSYHRNSLKRGGGVQIIPMEGLQAEQRYLYEPADNASPDQLFDRNWAEALVQAALTRLRSEYAAVGEADRFDRLKLTMMGHLENAGYEEIGRALGLSEGGVKTVVRRMRLRFSALLREELLQTLTDPDELEEELRYLLQCVK